MRIRIHLLLLLFLPLLAVSGEAASTSTWKTYDNDQQGFFIKHPPASRIEEKQGPVFDYVRIQQNNDPKNDHAMQQGEFLLEIFVVPQKYWGAKRGWPKCAEREDAKYDVVDNEPAFWRGFEASEGEGYVDSLCIQFKKRMYVLNAMGPASHREEMQDALRTFKLWRDAY